MHYCKYATGSVVITSSKTSCHLLNCLYLPYASLLGLAPYSRCILQGRSYKYRVALGLDVGWVPADDSAKTGQGVVCLLGDLVDVVVKAEYLSCG